MANQAEGGYLSPWLQTMRINQAAPFLQGRVLDIGCGNGALTKLSVPQHYFGYDIDSESLAIAQVRFPQYQFGKELPNEKFDTIAMLAVIEHVKQPDQFLKQLAAHLQGEGKIIITTPHPWFDWVHTLGAKLGLFSAHANEEHEELLDAKKMASLAQVAGLRLTLAKRFLFGANQLFILEKTTNSIN